MITYVAVLGLGLLGRTSFDAGVETEERLCRRLSASVMNSEVGSAGS